jgi:predicted glycogen debranching enzyme
MSNGFRRTLAKAPSRAFDDPSDPENTHEWLITNGFGGYAFGTVSGLITRRFHGLLIAALPAPLGRTMMLNYLADEIHFPDGRVVALSHQEKPDAEAPRPIAKIAEFWLDGGLPTWRYVIDDVVIEKQLVMPNRQNTIHCSYRLVQGGPVQLALHPYVQFRHHEGELLQAPSAPYELRVVGGRYEIHSPGLPPLRLAARGADAPFMISVSRLDDISYPIEKTRGYDSIGGLYAPGFFEVALTSQGAVSFVASTETWEHVDALPLDTALACEQERRSRLLVAAEPHLNEGVGAELVLAADQFVIRPPGRVSESARAKAMGDELRTVIAGYPWFTDWGRDTMISLEGLTLITGRHREARYILRTFSHYIRDGLIPNMFPEGTNAGLYHTADATLWFFHAIHRYVQTTNDRETLRVILPSLREIIEAHFRGTRFNIHVDPNDGLLSQGAKGYQLTWMDAKYDDVVVTPRRGKAVEINALFYNALMLLEGWVRADGDTEYAAHLAANAERLRASFNAKFWYPAGGYLYDVVDDLEAKDAASANDPSFRPNQLLAISLDHPVLEPEHWRSVVDLSRDRLLTPVGLRSLAPGSPDYKPKYFGDLKTRDMAYHQGTVWAWLIGPFIDAWLKVYPDGVAEAQQMLKGFEHHLGEACLGTISEIFDAEAPFSPRGCVAQAWSVAELLRSWVKVRK